MAVFSRFARWPNYRRKEATASGNDVQSEFVSDGDYKYTVGLGGNNSGPSYQEVSGAPVESNSPLGYSVGSITILFLNISMMIGTGIYSTPSAILYLLGSPGLSYFYWVIGFLLSASSLAVYLEYASYFPNRSGAEVVYLEQAYPRPRYLFPTTFALWYLILGFSSSNCIVLANYLFQINGSPPSSWELKGVAIAAWTVTILFLVFSTRISYWVSNAVGIIKVITLTFIAVTGLVVLGGHTRVEDPKANFRNSFSGTSDSPYGLATALVYIYFSYGGYNNAFNVVNEVKDPIRQVKVYSSISLVIVASLYILANTAYLAAVPLDELKASQQIAASLFFQKVFGSSGAVKGLNFLIALSAFGNLLSANLGLSRITRECGRQGVLPYPKFWASTWPFGTPFGPYLVKYVLTLIMILAPPAGDAFNFTVSLQLYPNAIYNVFLATGIYLVRWRRKKADLPEPQFKSWHIVILFNILVNLYLVVMPWYPPPGGANAGNFSFWYGTANVTGIGIIILCGIYYYLWIHGIPRWRGYRIRQETVSLADGGSLTHRLVQVPVHQLDDWDRTHDPLGRDLDHAAESGGYENSSEGVTSVNEEAKL